MYTFTLKCLRTTAIILLSLFFSLNIAYAKKNVSVSAKLSSTTISTDDTAFLIITINGAQRGQIQIPEVDNLSFQSRGQSTQMHFGNGKTSYSLTTTYTISATQPGNYALPPIKVKIGGDIFHTESLSLKVVGNQASGAANNKLTFLMVEGVKDELFPGEVGIITIKAYFKKGLRVEIPKNPELRGDNFVLTLLQEEPVQTVENMQGQIYSVLIYEAALSPIKEGMFQLGIQLETTLLIPQRNKRDPFSNHPFFDDDFFPNFFGGYQRKNHTLKSENAEITIAPLPTEGKPASFSGAIGEYDLSVTAVPQKVEVGEPITLTMSVSGIGNFDRVSAPVFPESQNFKTYNPSANFTPNKHQHNGTKTFEQAIVVQNDDIQHIPPLRFSYFDPGKKQYIVKQSQPIALEIKQGPSSAPQPVVKPQSVPENDLSKQGGLGFSMIKLHLGSFHKSIRPVYKTTLFFTIFLFCSLLLVIILVLTLRKKYISKNSMIIEHSKIQKDIRKELLQLGKELENLNSSTFLTRCRRIIQLQLGLKWNMEPSAITLQDLRDKNIASAAIVDLFSKAEHSVYSGVELSEKEMADYLSLLKKELEELS